MIYRTDLGSQVPKAGEQAAIIPEMSEDNPLVGLAQQFGQAIGIRGALRSAIGTPPNNAALQTTFEPHLRGAILVSAVFDAFLTIYIKRTRDLMRIGRAGGSVNASGELHPELASRLASTASKTAEHFLNICVRALDYCPPVDLRFGEFLRAIITADSDLMPDDEFGYRSELIKAFRLRGIIPEDVKSYSEESLRWSGPIGKPAGRCEGLYFDMFYGDRDEDLANNQRLRQKNYIILNKFAVANAETLGLDPKLPIQVHSYHPVHRVSPTGRLVIDFVVELLQQRDELLDPGDKKSQKFVFRGGSTVIFNHRGDVRYAIHKNINDKARLAAQRDFLSIAGSLAAFSPYVKDTVADKLNFQAVHRGY